MADGDSILPKDFRVAVLATDGFEETELTSPVQALRDAGADVKIISLKPGKIQAFKHFEKSIQVDVDQTIAEVDPSEFQGLVLPGGALNADQMRGEAGVKDFVRAFNDAGKPIAAICHAPWILISAGVLNGGKRTLTSWPSLQDDIRNAGGDWVDQEVVVKGNLVTSRKPDDLPVFNRETIWLFSSWEEREAQQGKPAA